MKLLELEKSKVVQAKTTNNSTSIPKLSPQEELGLVVSTLSRQGRRLGSKSLLVEIQSGDPSSKKPLFCFGAWWGDLAQHLDPKQPVYGLPVLAKAQNPNTHIKALAALYLEEIQSVQPEGPYFLAGYCFGGWVAFEIAQQLQAQGQKVALLTLVQRSGSAPIYRRYQPAVARFYRNLENINLRLAEHQHNLLKLSFANQLKYIAQLAGRVLSKPVGKPKKNHEGKKVVRVSKKNPYRTEVLKTLDLAMENYRPQPYSGAVALFFAKESGLTSFLFPRGGWGKLINNKSQVHVISGNHHNVLEQPYVQALAAKLNPCLDKAQMED